MKSYLVSQLEPLTYYSVDLKCPEIPLAVLKAPLNPNQPTNQITLASTDFFTRYPERRQRSVEYL